LDECNSFDVVLLAEAQFQYNPLPVYQKLQCASYSSYSAAVQAAHMRAKEAALSSETWFWK